MFDNPDDALWPNQFVNVRLLLETHKGSIVIPSVAVQTGPQGSYVFTVKPDKTVAVSPVTVSFTQNNVASITSGVNPGDVVVVDGQDKLQAGSKVDPHATTGGPNQNVHSSDTQSAPSAPTGAP
jgi:multidrug efflux system membrane fusion protein